MSTIVSLHGASAHVHASVPDAEDFDRQRQQLQTRARVETAVTRSNARNLAALAQWLVERRTHVERWTLYWPGPAPTGQSLPRLALVVPRVLHAAEFARRGGITVTTRGIPPCVLGPHAAHHEPSPERAFAPRCEACRSRASCPGVPAAYLDAFARDLELRPLP